MRARLQIRDSTIADRCRRVPPCNIASFSLVSSHLCTYHLKNSQIGQIVPELHPDCCTKCDQSPQRLETLAISFLYQRRAFLCSGAEQTSGATYSYKQTIVWSVPCRGQISNKARERQLKAFGVPSKFDASQATYSCWSLERVPCTVVHGTQVRK